MRSEALQFDYNEGRNRVSNARADQIQVVVNGVQRDAPEGASVLELLAYLEIAPDRVAVELNGAIVRKHDWPTTPVESGANLEIVQFVGGG